MLATASREAVTQRCRRIVGDTLGLTAAEIEEGSRFAGSWRSGGMAADSLDLVCIAMDVEDEFGIAIGDDEAERIESFGALVTLVIEKMGKSAR